MNKTDSDDLREAAGGWPSARNPVLTWLVNGTNGQRYIDNILVELCERLNAADVMVARATIHFRVHHPQFLGARILWKRGMAEASIDTFAYGVEATPQFISSPANELYNHGVNEVRQRLDDSSEDKGYPLYRDLRAEGFTDYIAWPLDHTLEKRHLVTFASDRPGGFTKRELATLKDILPVFALVSEVRLKNILSRTLLSTYVGPHASAQILAGATTRGSGVTVEAAIMICDLRDFTSISDLWPRDDVIEMLNGYFDALVEPVEAKGGEILKFMGDGLLAIFPLSNPDACGKLLDAIREARLSMTALNAQHQDKGWPELRFGVGVHVGKVMYGNIGSKRRLDFTAIGPAVNVASRLETLTKELGRPVLMSGAFVDRASCQNTVDFLGSHVLRGLGEPVEVHALRDVESAASAA